VNREMRRLQAKEEERAKKRRQDRSRPTKKERTSVQQFVREVRQELKKVAWPSRQELITYTAVVFLVTTTLTLLIFGLDWAFNKTIFTFLENAAV